MLGRQSCAYPRTIGHFRSLRRPGLHSVRRVDHPPFIGYGLVLLHPQLLAQSNLLTFNTKIRRLNEIGRQIHQPASIFRQAERRQSELNPPPPSSSILLLRQQIHMPPEGNADHHRNFIHFLNPSNHGLLAAPKSLPPQNPSLQPKGNQNPAFNHFSFPNTSKCQHRHKFNFPHVTTLSTEFRSKPQITPPKASTMLTKNRLSEKLGQMQPKFRRASPDTHPKQERHALTPKQGCYLVTSTRSPSYERQVTHSSPEAPNARR